MALREEFERVGNWLFRWRSYLPLLLIIVFLFALVNFQYPFGSRGLDRVWEILCLVISFSGLLVRAYAVGCAPKGTSGRNVMEQRASFLNTTGLYSIIRHPLYFGNFLIWFGIVLSIRSWWFVILTVLIFWFYYEKIMFAEEEFLRRQYGETFLKWANDTPAFLPLHPSKWKKSELPFELKNALRREYSGFFAIIATYSVLELIEDIIVQRRLVLDPFWVALFFVGLGVYLICMYLKKKTTFLDIPGR